MITRAVALASSEWLVTGPLDSDGRVKTAAKRVVGSYVQMAVAAEIADRIQKNAASEEELLYKIMLVVRSKVLNQNQFDHIPRKWPALVAGAGYCDQINGAVATIAVRHFEKAQLYGLYEPDTMNSPHTIGRVWSSKRNDWIYFDAFYDVPRMFTRGEDRVPKYLNVAAAPPVASRGAVPVRYYSLPGWMMTDMKRTFGEFLLSRASTDALKPTSKEAPVAVAPAGPITNQPVPVLPPPENVRPDAFRDVSREYIRARLDDLLDDSANYRVVAEEDVAKSDDRAREIAAMAAAFVHDSSTTLATGEAP